MTRRPAPDLLPGTLDLLILRTLQTEPLHGWAISERIQQISAGRPADQPGLALPGAPPARASGLDRGRMGRLGAGPAGEVLPAHRIRTPAAGHRSRRVGAHVHRDRARDEAGVSAHESPRSETSRFARCSLRAACERELDEELAFHIERETQKQIANGVSPAEARDRARARFGSVPLAADECRDARGTAFIDGCVRDILYAFRTFRRAPLAALTIVTTVALGLGLVAVVFTFLNVFVFRVDEVPNRARAVRGRAPANVRRRSRAVHAAAIRSAAPRDRASSPMRSRCCPISTAASTAA